jgi:hypothetical protein
MKDKQKIWTSALFEGCEEERVGDRVAKEKRALNRRRGRKEEVKAPLAEVKYRQGRRGEK